jgi:hypothetical protein
MSTVHKILEKTIWMINQQSHYGLLITGVQAAERDAEMWLVRDDGREAIRIDFGHLYQSASFVAYEIDPFAFDKGESFIEQELDLKTNDIQDLVQYLVLNVHDDDED